GMVERGQQGDQVRAVRRIQVAQASVLGEGAPAARQLQLEQVGVMTGAEQHRLGAQLHALLASREHALADGERLLALVARKAELRLRAALALGPQPLREAEAVLAR